jgi:two-component system phosphate regulon sensor histidine kinase PhoR
MGLLLFVLLPALFYSAYELTTLSESEALVTDVYRRQLDGVLFSLNQYSWDVANGWASAIEGALAEHRASPADTVTRRLLSVIERSVGLQAVLLADTAGRGLRWITRSDASLQPGMKEILAAARAQLAPLPGLRRLGYRKLEPLPLPPKTGEGRDLLLVFATESDEPEDAIAAMFLNDSLFVHLVLGPRIREAAGSDFLLAVVRSGVAIPLLATGPAATADLGQRKDLWLFPDLSLGIRLAGTSIDEIVRSRFRKNLVLILGLDCLLLAAAAFIYRSVRREMEFARTKSDFVSTVSHELRTPLALIRMYAETLEMDRLTDPARRRHYLATIVREADRLGRLVTNMLNFSRIEAGRMPYRFARLDLTETVRGVLESYADHLRQRGFDPVVDLAPGLPAIRADAEAIQEALINLIDNATKYSADRRYLRIATGTARGKVFAEVEDKGIGIPRKHQEKVFEMFYRVSDGLVQNSRGSGLGLPLVKHVMRAHGGSVTLHSTPGLGSTFRLSFPSANATPRAETSEGGDS